MALVRYFASARAAAGVTEDEVDVSTMSALRAELGCRHGERFAEVLAVSSLLVDGVGATDQIVLTKTTVVEVLPPFAGG